MQRSLTTISKTVGLNSVYSSIHYFADRDYRKSCAHLAEGLVRLTVTAALTGFTIIASYEAWRYTQINNPLTGIDNALDDNNINLAMKYANKIDLPKGFSKITNFCLGNQDIECALNVASKIFSEYSRNMQFETISLYCLGEENITCAKDVAAKISDSYYKDRQFKAIAQHYLGEKNIEGAMEAASKISSGYSRREQFENIARFCIGQGNIKCALAAVENIDDSIYKAEPLERLNKLCKAKGDTECVTRTHKEQARHNLFTQFETRSSKESAGLETLKILGIDSVSLLNSIPDDKAKNKQLIEKKCAKALKVIHPDKSKTSGDAFSSFVKMCTNAVMAIKQ